MPAQNMFFCVSHNAYMLVESCRTLRQRPVGKAPGGAQTRPIACERCQLHSRVDALDLPTVPLASFLKGIKPASPVPSEE